MKKDKPEKKQSKQQEAKDKQEKDSPMGLESELIDDTADDEIVDATTEDTFNGEAVGVSLAAEEDMSAESVSKNDELAEIEELTKEEIRKIINERDDLKDQLLRTAADYDNHIKRTRKEKQDIRESTTSEVIGAFLNVIDNFERALTAEDSTFEQLFEGLKMIHLQMLDVLRDFNVRPINSVGEEFDPEYHEAMVSEPTSEHPDHTIMEEFLKGYTFNEKLLRPAKVKVAVEMDEDEIAKAKERLEEKIKERLKETDESGDEQEDMADESSEEPEEDEEPRENEQEDKDK